MTRCFKEKRPQKWISGHKNLQTYCKQQWKTIKALNFIHAELINKHFQLVFDSNKKVESFRAEITFYFAQLHKDDFAVGETSKK